MIQCIFVRCFGLSKGNVLIYEDVNGKLVEIKSCDVDFFEFDILKRERQGSPSNYMKWMILSKLSNQHHVLDSQR